MPRTLIASRTAVAVLLLLFTQTIQAQAADAFNGLLKAVTPKPAAPGTTADAAAIADPRYRISATGAEVTDSATGLTWRRCSEGMQWTGSECGGRATVFTALMRVLAHARTQPGWRVPTQDELRTLANVNPRHAGGVMGPGGIDAVAFPQTVAQPYWSATLYYKERGDRDRTKMVSFINGLEDFLDNGDQGMLRLVSSGGATTAAATPIPMPRTVVAGGARLQLSKDGREVIDSVNHLAWRRCAEGMNPAGGGCGGSAIAVDYNAAEARAQSQAKATRTAWRLPTKDELLTIADEKRFKMAIDTALFPNTPPEHFWTSHKTANDYVYAVNFYNGFHYERYRTSAHHVRLVRDLQ